MIKAKFTIIQFIYNCHFHHSQVAYIVQSCTTHYAEFYVEIWNIFLLQHFTYYLILVKHSMFPLVPLINFYFGRWLLRIFCFWQIIHIRPVDRSYAYAHDAHHARYSLSNFSFDVLFILLPHECTIFPCDCSAECWRAFVCVHTNDTIFIYSCFWRQNLAKWKCYSNTERPTISYRETQRTFRSQSQNGNSDFP